MTAAWILIILGLLVVFGTHIALIAMPLMALGIPHAVANIGAGVFILVGVFVMPKKKGKK